MMSSPGKEIQFQLNHWFLLSWWFLEYNYIMTIFQIYDSNPSQLCLIIKSIGLKNVVIFAGFKLIIIIINISNNIF